MNTVVCFSSCGNRTCLWWVPKDIVNLCATCQQRGHHAAQCRTNRLVCSKCGGGHTVHAHAQYCELCKAGNGHECVPKCTNCSGPHSSNSKTCPFWAACYNYALVQELIQQRWDELLAKRMAAGGAPGTPQSKGNNGKGKGREAPHPLFNTAAGTSRATMAKPIIKQGITGAKPPQQGLIFIRPPPYNPRAA